MAAPAEPGYEVSYDPARVDRDLVHRFLSEESYWSRGIPRAVVDAALDASLVAAVYAGDEQVAHTRVVTDGATFAWMADVFVIAGHRGRGLGRQVVEAALRHPALPTDPPIRSWILRTSDAHELYRRFGFHEARPDNVMIRGVPAEELYRAGRADAL